MSLLKMLVLCHSGYIFVISPSMSFVCCQCVCSGYHTFLATRQTTEMLLTTALNSPVIGVTAMSWGARFLKKAGGVRKVERRGTLVSSPDSILSRGEMVW